MNRIKRRNLETKLNDDKVIYQIHKLIDANITITSLYKTINPEMSLPVFIKLFNDNYIKVYRLTDLGVSNEKQIDTTRRLFSRNELRSVYKANQMSYKLTKKHFEIWYIRIEDLTHDQLIKWL